MEQGFQPFGKWLLIIGLVIAAIGLMTMVGPKVPFLGKLPGDIYIKRENFSFYFPLGTCILLSLILTVIIRLFHR